MGKHKSGKINVQKKDVFQRLNYLYQTAHMVLSMKQLNTVLVKYYTDTMVSLALKNVVRLSPHIKRTLCKICNMLLVPGVTCRVRYKGKNKKGKRVVVTCLDCGAMKSFFLNQAHSLWNDRPENILEVVSMDKSSESKSVNSIINMSDEPKGVSVKTMYSVVETAITTKQMERYTAEPTLNPDQQIDGVATTFLLLDSSESVRGIASIKESPKIISANATGNFHAANTSIHNLVMENSLMIPTPDLQCLKPNSTAMDFDEHKNTISHSCSKCVGKSESTSVVPPLQLSLGDEDETSVSSRSNYLDLSPCILNKFVNEEPFDKSKTACKDLEKLTDSTS